MRLVIQDDLYLESIQEKHAESLFGLIETNRVYLREWMPWEKNQVSIKDTLVFIRKAEFEFREGTALQAGIFSGGILSGMIGLHQINLINKNTCMGYWLAESMQGRGLMNKACQRLMNYCFEQLHLHRIEVHCGLENIRSQAVAERLGFHREGILKEVEWLNGKFIDHLLYGLIHSKA